MFIAKKGDTFLHLTNMFTYVLFVTTCSLGKKVARLVNTKTGGEFSPMGMEVHSDTLSEDEWWSVSIGEEFRKQSEGVPFKKCGTWMAKDWLEDYKEQEEYLELRTDPTEFINHWMSEMGHAYALGAKFAYVSKKDCTEAMKELQRMTEASW